MKINSRRWQSWEGFTYCQRISSGARSLILLFIPRKIPSFIPDHHLRHLLQECEACSCWSTVIRLTRLMRTHISLWSWPPLMSAPDGTRLQPSCDPPPIRDANGSPSPPRWAASRKADMHLLAATPRVVSDRSAAVDLGQPPGDPKPASRVTGRSLSLIHI